VSLRRLRAGEWLAAVGAVALVVALCLDWFRARGGPGTDPGATGWSAIGWVLALILVVVAGLAAWLAAATATDASVAQPVMAAVLLGSLAPVSFVALLLRVAVVQPGDDTVVAARPAAYAGLVALALVVAGAWRSLADERIAAPESAYTPPPARPAPPARA
jgi:hypothetical protein